MGPDNQPQQVYLSRRKFIVGIGALAASSALLAACGRSGEQPYHGADTKLSEDGQTLDINVQGHTFVLSHVGDGTLNMVYDKRWSGSSMSVSIAGNWYQAEYMPFGEKDWKAILVPVDVNKRINAFNANDPVVVCFSDPVSCGIKSPSFINLGKDEGVNLDLNK